MPHRRRVQKGSFASHLDELLAKFPEGEPAARRESRSPKRSPELQEKIDIHALLFARAWEIDDGL
jgi:hypothetical protein